MRKVRLYLAIMLLIVLILGIAVVLLVARIPPCLP